MKRIGISELRKMNATKLRNLTEPLEICGRDLQPLRVLIPYTLYLQLQDEAKKLEEHITTSTVPAYPYPGTGS
jgi:hypothetical protein